MLAPAKINLYLHVLGRRADGYHLLDSLVAFASVGDELSVEPASDLRLTIAGRFGQGLEADGSNLVLRAARALQRAADVEIDRGAHFRLVKNLPLASGIGGGSSDAACALRLLARLWGIALDGDRLHSIALSLGADVPVCLQQSARFMGGIGEDLQPAGPLPDCHVVLANPQIATPTQAVFSARQGPFSRPARWERPPRNFQDLIGFLRATGNDLTEAAKQVTPEIATVLRELASLPGAGLSRLSGSGATCFALFEDEGAARGAAEWLRSARPNWWVAVGSLLS